ncbi:Ribosomal N-lysine methyltransferase set11 [Leucoagaricus sp. SymC.cos]|nr:Ribosomal N-lysine methyltransferase set11 [Leucoagaricus sp. SymC.cos]
MSNSVHPRWEALLEWLRHKGMDTDNILVEARATPGAGYGLYALQEIPPSTPLFKVPAKAMMNIRTLVALYPKTRPKLTATQIMSLHLLLHRPISQRDLSKDTIFGPYISILPSDFDAHPLTWLIEPRDPRTEQEDLEIGHNLLEHAPKGVLNTLEDVAARFRKDWERVSQYLRDNQTLLAEAKARGRKLRPLDSTTTQLEFLWGWLNVNTRCIYHRLCPTRQDPNNMTMCPILDFANHTNHLPHTYPQPSNAEVWDQAPASTYGDDFALLSPKDKTLFPGEEVFLKYGAHSNRTLFTEYGFVNELDPDALEQLDCEADITWRMLRFFAKRGNIGVWMEELLRSANYWGEWTVHSKPEPAHPSFRLISALRLYHSIPMERILPPHNDHEIVRRWQETILGYSGTVSPENEIAWRESLNKLCLGIDNETGIYLDNLNKVGREWLVDSWVHHMRRCLLMLWREQQHAAWCVHQSLESGEEF